MSFSYAAAYYSLIGGPARRLAARPHTTLVQNEHESDCFGRFKKMSRCTDAETVNKTLLG